MSAKPVKHIFLNRMPDDVEKPESYSEWNWPSHHSRFHQMQQVSYFAQEIARTANPGSHLLIYMDEETMNGVALARLCLVLTRLGFTFELLIWSGHSRVRVNLSDMVDSDLVFIRS